MTMWLGTLGILVVVTILARYILRRKYKLPPGPRGLPYFGNIFQLENGKTHKTLTAWSQIYGDIFKIKLFGEDFIVLNSYDSIYEVLVKKANEFAGRPTSFRSSVLGRDIANITLSTFSPKWLYMKKMAMQALKMYGDNTIKMAALNQQHIEDMLEEIGDKSQKDQAFDIYPILNQSITATITSVIYGKKETKEKVEIFARITENTEKFLQPAGMYVMLDVFPWLRFFPLHMVQELYETSDQTSEWYLAAYFGRKEDYVAGDPQCFVDSLIDQQTIAKEKQPEFVLSDEEIAAMTRNLMLAGTVTTITTMNALVAVLITKQDIQQKLVEEINEILQKRPPKLADKAFLPYTEAVILEILRYSSVVPLNLAHYTMVDTTVNGYEIPKDTQVLTNLWNLHHSEDYWEEPWVFKPERFIGNDGNLLTPDHIHRKRLLPFGASRRVCPGENLARNRLFLLVTSLIQNYQLLPESPDKLPNIDPRNHTSTLSIIIPPYKIKAIHRR